MQTERNKVLNTIRADEEEKIAVAMARKQHEKERSEREVQRLREQSEELRGCARLNWVGPTTRLHTTAQGVSFPQILAQGSDVRGLPVSPRSLAEKIRVARVNKERKDQLVEKKVLGEQVRPRARKEQGHPSDWQAPGGLAASLRDGLSLWVAKGQGVGAGRRRSAGGTELRRLRCVPTQAAEYERAFNQFVAGAAAEAEAQVGSLRCACAGLLAMLFRGVCVWPLATRETCAEGIVEARVGR